MPCGRTDKDPEESIDEDLKKEVDNIIERCKLPKTCSCVPSTVSEGPGIQYAHCLSGPVSQSLLRTLAYKWNMNCDIINIDTVWNILPCIVNLFFYLLKMVEEKPSVVDALSYHQFIRRQWFLVPEEHVIQEFEKAQAKKAKKFPYLEVPPGGFRYHLLIGDSHHCCHDLPSSALNHLCHSHIQPQYAICRIGRHLPTFPNVATYVGLCRHDPREGLYDLTVLAGRCANLYHLWAHPDKRNVEMKARPKACQPFSSSHDYRGRMGEERRSSIVEWLKKVPPGSPGIRDLS